MSERSYNPEILQEGKYCSSNIPFGNKVSQWWILLKQKFKCWSSQVRMFFIWEVLQVNTVARLTVWQFSHCDWFGTQYVYGFHKEVTFRVLQHEWDQLVKKMTHSTWKGKQKKKGMILEKQNQQSKLSCHLLPDPREIISGSATDIRCYFNEVPSVPKGIKIKIIKRHSNSWKSTDMFLPWHETERTGSEALCCLGGISKNCLVKLPRLKTEQCHCWFSNDFHVKPKTKAVPRQYSMIPIQTRNTTGT